MEIKNYPELCFDFEHVFRLDDCANALYRKLFILPSYDRGEVTKVQFGVSKLGEGRVVYKTASVDGMSPREYRSFYFMERTIGGPWSVIGASQKHERTARRPTRFEVPKFVRPFFETSFVPERDRVIKLNGPLNAVFDHVFRLFPRERGEIREVHLSNTLFGQKGEMRKVCRVEGVSSGNYYLFLLLVRPRHPDARWSVEAQARSTAFIRKPLSSEFEYL